VPFAKKLVASLSSVLVSARFTSFLLTYCIIINIIFFQNMCKTGAIPHDRGLGSFLVYKSKIFADIAII
jgi:hypothetical protein